MPRVSFTPHLRQHVGCDDADVAGATLREALDAAFAVRPGLRGYLVDEHGQLRQHVAVFIDGQPAADRTTLADAVRPDSAIYVLQALSGG